MSREINLLGVKKNILLSLLTSVILVGCGSDTLINENDDNDDDDTNSGTISLHNQGVSCLSCHDGNGGYLSSSYLRDNDDDDDDYEDDDHDDDDDSDSDDDDNSYETFDDDGDDDNDEQFTSGATVYTTLNGTTSDTYASGYKIRLVLENTGTKITYNSGRGTGNSNTAYPSGSINSYTAQVINSSDVVVNSSLSNSHGVDRLDCNTCHTATGNSSAPGRITSYDYYASLSNVEDTTDTNTTDTITFATNIMNVLEAKCKTCHTSGGQNEDFLVSDMESTYTNIVTNSYVDTSSVDDSKLLTKGSNTLAHLGGNVIATTSTEYQTLRSWISDGASDTSTTDIDTTTDTTTTETISFASAVMPVLESKCKSCHGNDGDFTITDAASTYSNLSTFSFINTASVDDSKILTKSKGVSHGGGTILSTTSTQYTTLRGWISQGALNN